MIKRLFILFIYILFASCSNFPPKYIVNYELKADFNNYEKKYNIQLNKDKQSEMIRDIVNVLRYRFDKLGASDIIIQPDGNIIKISAKVIQTPDRVKIYSLSSGIVEIKLVNDSYSKKASDYYNKYFSLRKNIIEAHRQQYVISMINKKLSLPRTLETLFYYKQDNINSKLMPQYPLVVYSKSLLNGKDISKSWNSIDDYGNLCVHFVTTDEGKLKFADATSQKNYGKKLAIIVDDKIRSAPAVNTQITTGQAMINGNFSKDEIEILLLSLRRGSIPVHLDVVNESYSSIK